jgi:DNA polymerase elongation subunit (family B)
MSFPLKTKPSTLLVETTPSTLLVEKYDKFIRKPMQWDPSQDIKFQIVSWFDKDSGHLDPMTMQEAMEDYNSNVADPKEYNMHLFGITKEGYSVQAKVTGFMPFFYVKIPEKWGQFEIEKFIKYIQNKKYASEDEQSGIKMWYKYQGAICNIQRVKRFDLDAGYTNDTLFDFIGIQFKNYEAMQRCSWTLWKERTKDNCPASGIKLYESNLQPMLRFMHIRKILSIGWVTLPADKYYLKTDEDDKDTFCQIEADIDWKDIEPDNDNDNIAPIRQASFDIECFSINGQVPIPEIPGNECIQIATAIKDYGREGFTLKYIITLKQCAPIKDAIVDWCTTEKEVLIKWKRFMETVDPDILIGYNIFDFDLNYIYIRARITGCVEVFRFLSKLKDHQCELKESQLKSNAYGDNHWQMVEMPGRSQIDLLPVIKKEKSYTSYTLGFVSTEILKETKHDLTPKQIFDYYKDGSLDKITTIAEYCIQDTVLPQRIIDKMNILINLIEMAKVTRVPLDYLITRGQQVKVFSQITETSRNAQYVVPHIKKSKFVQKVRYDEDDSDEEEEGYEGATVLEPKVGSYWDAVAALDFKALYPTTEIDWNLCYTSLVKNDKKYGNIPGEKYNIVDIVIQKGNPNIEIIVFEAAYQITVQFKYFPKVALNQLEKVSGMTMLPKATEATDPKNVQWVWRATYGMQKLKIIQRILPQATVKKIYKWAQNKQGLIPQILINLLKARDKAKKQMAAAIEAGDKFMEDVYNGKQLALKVSCNSVYGFTGCTETGKLPCKPIAECTTTIGRGMIESSKQFAENLENFKDIMQCVDHFPEDYPYLIQDTIKNGFFVGSAKLLINRLFKVNIDPENRKDYYPIDDGGKFLIYTDEGYQSVTGLIIKWDEKMYKFETPKGKVFSMQQYSCDVIYGDSVSADTPVLVRNTRTNRVSIKSIDSLDTNQKWEDYSQFKGIFDKGHSDKLQSQIEDLEVWTCDKQTKKGKWTPIKRVIKHKTHKKIFRVVTNTGCVDVTEDHSLLNTNLEIVKPEQCHIGLELMHAPYTNATDDTNATDTDTNDNLLLKNCINTFTQNVSLKKISRNGFTMIRHNQMIKIQTKCKLKCAIIYRILASQGYNNLIRYIYGLYNIVFDATRQDGSFKMANWNRIVQIIQLPNTTTNEYVYDIETEEGYFQAGIGDLIVKNTDSIFCNFDTTMQTGMANKVGYSMVVGAYVSERITEYLRSFNPFKEDKDKWSELEYEKVYGNLLLFTKKRYTGTLYDFNPLKYKYIDKKGIALKRRDYCQLVKDVYAGALNILFDASLGEPPQRIQIAKKFVMEQIEFLLQGNTEPEKLILSKSLRDSYKIREKKQKKTQKMSSFNPTNVYIKDHLVINHKVLGTTEGVVISKQEIKIENFFKGESSKYPLEIRIESCENDEYLKDIDTMYPQHQGLPFAYDDIVMKKGFEISLKKILDPATTDAELIAVTQAHVRLTRRMYLRDPGSAPVSGERVPYMFVFKKGDVLQHEKAEHPDYVKLYNLKPDPKYYLDNQLRKPIQQLFALLMPNPESLFDDLIRKYHNSATGQKELTNYFGTQKSIEDVNSIVTIPKTGLKSADPDNKKNNKRKKQDDKQPNLQKWFGK